MGAGASFDPSSSDVHYFCHNCNRNFLTSPRGGGDLTCPNCNSSFIEEVEQTSRRRGHYQLSEEQARRLSSAAALLQLLESQLREELNMLQANNDEADKRPKLTKLMRESLRAVFVDLDKIVSQPGCPVCSEDYAVGDAATQLPCGHIYHESCVMPWLESKLTCPICRYEMANVVPPLVELQELSQEELLKRIASRQEDNDQVDKLDTMSRVELSEYLHQLLKDEQREHELEQQQQQQQLNSPIFPAPSPNSAAAAAAASIMFSASSHMMQHPHQTNESDTQQAAHRTSVRRYRTRNALRQQLIEQQQQHSRSYVMNWLDVDNGTQDSDETALSTSSNDTTSLVQDHNSIVNTAFHRDPQQLLLRPSGMSATPQRTYVLQSLQNGSGMRLMQAGANNENTRAMDSSNMLSSTSYRPRSLRQLMEEN